MKTVIINSFGGPEVLDLVDIPMVMPKDDEVLVRAHARGVGRADALMRQGRYKWSPRLPFSPGNQPSRRDRSARRFCSKFEAFPESTGEWGDRPFAAD